MPAADDTASAVDVLTAAGIPFTLHTHAEIRTEQDILALGRFPMERSVKALAFTAGGGRIVLAAVPGPARVHYGRLATALGVRRAELTGADPEVLARLGMRPGGITPVCVDPEVTVVFDAAVPGLGQVFCGSGRADQTLELGAADLMSVPPESLVAEICAPAA
jgi:Cys-tRNA(Pro)/Cys-tRNA(Cys) deacylase